jgi:hypothetical protein
VIVKTRNLASLTFAEILGREIDASGKSHGQIGRESGVPDALIGMYQRGRREPTLRNARRLCAVLPGPRPLDCGRIGSRYERLPQSGLSL